MYRWNTMFFGNKGNLMLLLSIAIELQLFQINVMGFCIQMPDKTNLCKSFSTPNKYPVCQFVNFTLLKILLVRWVPSFRLAHKIIKSEICFWCKDWFNALRRLLGLSVSSSWFLLFKTKIVTTKVPHPKIT